MIQVVVKQHTEGELAGTWDIYAHDRSVKGDLLVFSNQGYENRQFAEHIADRLFGHRAGVDTEHVDLVVINRDGHACGGHRMLR